MDRESVSAFAKLSVKQTFLKLFGDAGLAESRPPTISLATPKWSERDGGTAGRFQAVCVRHAVLGAELLDRGMERR